MTTPQQKFINKAYRKFKDVISCKSVNYINQYTPVIISCNIHEISYEISPKALLKSKNHGCKLCYNKNQSIYNSSKYIFLDIKKQHSHIDYSKIVYTHRDDLGEFICKIHKISFMQKFRDHYRGNGGCPECKNEKKLKVTKYTTEEFVEQSKKRFPNKFTYHNTIYTHSQDKIIITCVKHGDFNLVAAEHLGGCGGCTKCKNSYGEEQIALYLNKFEIKYDFQKKFDNCINPITGKKLLFDFYIPDKNLIIEFHGLQHFKEIKWFGGQKAFKERVFRDGVKENYCLNHGIKFHIIKYNDILLNELNKIFI